jgi:SAM-dependent methyltransferase
MMSLYVLGNHGEINRARYELRRRGIDCTSWWITGILRKYWVLQGMNVGDVKKSWDVLKTVDFIQNNLNLSDPILDIGAYRSETLPILKKLGHTELTGIDLNSNIGAMPGNDVIRYQVADCYQAPFDNESFAAVTAISVIEHGFDSKRLLAELGRIIRTNGYFIASMDYWPDKIDTSGINAYGMDWRIFSKEDVMQFIDDAERVGLRPVGDLTFEARKPLVSWMGKNFTFAWLALQKR